MNWFNIALYSFGTSTLALIIGVIVVTIIKWIGRR
jgi:hypothetical protein